MPADLVEFDGLARCLEDLQQPEVIRSFRKSELWTLEELDRVMPSLLDAKKAHDERVRVEGAPEQP